MSGEVVYTAANAKCSANLKVKGNPTLFINQSVDTLDVLPKTSSDSVNK